MFELVPVTTADAFAALQHAHEHRRAAEVAEKIAILRAAQLYEVESDDVMEGMERMVSPGGDGTPLIGEFLAMELAGILGVSPDSALWQIGEVLDVRFRHPALWESFLSGRVWFWQAAKIASECRQLAADAVAKIDRRTAHALQLWPWARLMRELPSWIVDADPERAAGLETLARADRRLVVTEIRDGHCELYGRLAPEDAIAFDQALDTVAAGLPVPELPDGVTLSGSQADRYRLGHRRAAAVGVLARQAFGQEALPVQLIVHIDAHDAPMGDRRSLSLSKGVARVEGWGTLLNSALPNFLAGSTVIVRPVLDPAMVQPSDAYEPSPAMRLAIQTRNPVDVFPFSSRPARSCDLDHTEPYRQDGPPGQTGLHNLGPLSRRTHRGSRRAALARSP